MSLATIKSLIHKNEIRETKYPPIGRAGVKREKFKRFTSYLTRRQAGVSRFTSPKGFTLIELLVATSIVVTILGIGLARYSEFNRRQIVDQAIQELKSNLRLAQNKALNGEKNCTSAFLGYRVLIFGDRYCLRSACQDNEGLCRWYDFPAQVGAYAVSGFSGFLFNALAKGVEEAGEVYLSGYGTYRKVVVETAGNIYIEAVASLPGDVVLLGSFIPTPTPDPASTPTPTLPLFPTLPPTPTPTFVPTPTPTTQQYSSELLVNPSFETADYSGWTWPGGGTPRVDATGGESCSCSSIHQGNYGFWTQTASHSDYLYQEISLAAWLTEIQAGDAQIRAQGWFGCGEPGQNNWDWIRFIVRFYDSGNNEIVSSRYDSGGIYDQHNWVQLGINDFAIPTNAVKVRFEVYVSEPGWDACGADDFTVKVKA